MCGGRESAIILKKITVDIFQLTWRHWMLYMTIFLKVWKSGVTFLLRCWWSAASGVGLIDTSRARIQPRHLWFELFIPHHTRDTSVLSETCAWAQKTASFIPQCSDECLCSFRMLDSEDSDLDEGPDVIRHKTKLVSVFFSRKVLIMWPVVSHEWRRSSLRSIRAPSHIFRWNLLVRLSSCESFPALQCTWEIEFVCVFH